MILFAFPFFLLKLTIALFFTLLHVLTFQTSSRRAFVANGLLTLVAIGLAAAWWFLPTAAKQSPPSLHISLQNSPTDKPLYVTVETSQLPKMLEEYEYAVLQQPFVPQYRYINLAILASAAQQPELATQFEKLARSIDPNQDFFSD